MGVGNREAAIRVLHDILVAKKYRPWEKALEEVCVKYVGLCVLARDARMGKDGLYQFRVNCQPNNFASLEIAIRHFLDSSEQRIEKALSDAARAAELIEKADKPLSPEEQWLLAATGEGPVDRSDREHITPWLKFLWEAYRTTLDLLKTNAKLEKLYHVRHWRLWREVLRVVRVSCGLSVLASARFTLVELLPCSNDADAAAGNGGPCTGVLRQA